MARMPGAEWRPVPNCTTGGQDAVQGVVLHIMEGTLDGSDSWFRNPQSQASSHFGVGRDGRIYQWVDTADRAWAQVSGNRTWLSIEHEGHSGDSLTPAQLAATARIVAWAHDVHDVPLQSTDSVTGRGVGWHGMGGVAWGGHINCPGDPIRAQRGAIITAAKGGTSPVQEDDMPLTAADVETLLSTKIDDPTKPGAATVTVRGALWAAYGQANAANAAAQKATAQVGALTGLVTQLTAAVQKGGSLTAAQATASAEAGAKAALAELGAALTD